MKKTTTSVLVWDAQANLLSAAAQKRGMNVSEYVREVVVPLVANEATLPVPNVPKIARRASSQSGTHAINVDELAKLIAIAVKKQVG